MVSKELSWDSFAVCLLAGRRPMLEARGLTKYYGSVLAVQNIDFSLDKLAAIEAYEQEGGVNLWERPAQDLRP